MPRIRVMSAPIRDVIWVMRQADRRNHDSCSFQPRKDRYVPRYRVEPRSSGVSPPGFGKGSTRVQVEVHRRPWESMATRPISARALRRHARVPSSKDSAVVGPSGRVAMACARLVEVMVPGLVGVVGSKRWGRMTFSK